MIEENILKDCKKNKKPSNLGELKTAFMSALLYIMGNDKINVFVSEDRRARRCMVLQYAKEYHQLKTLSITGVFYVLKDILNIDEAKAYINQLSQSFKIYDKKNNTVKVSGIEVIDYIYNDDAVLVKDGMIKLK